MLKNKVIPVILSLFAAITAIDVLSVPSAAQSGTDAASLFIEGINVVYCGESYKYSVKDRERISGEIFWDIEGSSGAVFQDGTFTALKKGTVTLKAKAVDSKLEGSLVVHCIKDAADIDFIPSVNGVPIANKSYRLPENYDPGLSGEAYAAFQKLQRGAKNAGLTITMISGYRSYSTQRSIYNSWYSLYGSEANRFSALPGYSEHQLGLAIDVNSCDNSFAYTPEAKWVKDHCSEYGFIVRYPSNSSEKYTGYQYEPWHLRYLGTELAAEITESGVSLEEYFGIESSFRSGVKEVQKTSVSALDYSGIQGKSNTEKDNTPEIIISDNGYILKNGTDYYITYKNIASSGTAAAIVNGKGGYTGTKAIFFNIDSAAPAASTDKPAAASRDISKLSPAAICSGTSGGKYAISWNEIAEADGYIVFWSANGGAFKKIAEFSNDTFKCDISFNANKKYTYRFKVQAVKKDGKSLCYSQFSNIIRI